jgi:hypothetical protein
MKNLFDPKVKEEILSRIDHLTPGAKAQWGKMNVNQGLRHMAMAFDVATGKLDPTPAATPPMPKWLLRFFLLNIKPPKGRAETFKEMNTVANKIDPADFEIERTKLKMPLRIFQRRRTWSPKIRWLASSAETIGANSIIITQTII